MLSFPIVMTVAVAAIAFVAWPLRAGAPLPGEGVVDPRLLEARDRALLAKERKLDEIRELRADRQSGKLAHADAAVLERALRAQAADLLHVLDRADAAIAEASGDGPLAPESAGDSGRVSIGTPDALR
jgi:hypothetical protein